MPNDFDDELTKQFPPRVPPPPNIEMSDVPDDVFYPEGPPEIVSMPLERAKYAGREAAMARVRELCERRGLKFMRMFETARHYVAHCVKG
jgi:hypothetical protein